MTRSEPVRDVAGAWRQVRLMRLVALLLLAIAAGLISDWLRRDRIVFPAPLPEFTTAPAGR